MSSAFPSTLLPIQRAMAKANPLAWRDGVVLSATDDEVVIAFLDESVTRLRVAGPALELVAGEPVAYHPVAEIIDAGHIATTARL